MKPTKMFCCISQLVVSQQSYPRCVINVHDDVMTSTTQSVQRQQQLPRQLTITLPIADPIKQRLLRAGFRTLADFEGVGSNQLAQGGLGHIDDDARSSVVADVWCKSHTFSA